MPKKPIATPTKEELLKAVGRKVPDIIGSGLDALFCGINPSLYSAAVGHHFARPGNRFWPALQLAGFTPRLFSPFEDQDLLDHGLGVTNVVDRATARADEVRPEEFVAGAKVLEAKIERYRPRFLAVLGIGAYRIGFGKPEAGWGLQSDSIGRTRIWVLPNPSGLNANFQLPDLVRVFGELKAEIRGR